MSKENLFKDIFVTVWYVCLWLSKILIIVMLTPHALDWSVVVYKKENNIYLIGYKN